MRADDFCFFAIADAVICAFFGLMLGAPKNRGVEGFLLGFLLGPIGLVVIAVQGKVYKRRCPYCRAGIPEKASRCRHCAADLSPRFENHVQPIMAIPISAFPAPVHFYYIGCKQELSAAAGQRVSCPYCHAVMQAPGP